MRMDARRVTKVVVRATSRGGRQSRRRIAQQPEGTGLAGSLPLSLGLQMAPTICCALLRAIIPGQRPVAPAWGLIRGSLGTAVGKRKRKCLQHVARRRVLNEGDQRR